MKNTGSKIVTASIKIQDILNDSHFFSIPGETRPDNEIQNILFSKYSTRKGKLEIYIEKDTAFIQWRPEYVDANAEILHGEALQIAKTRKFEAAIEKWKQAILINATDIEYRYHLGLVFYELKKYSESIQTLENVIQICPIHFKSQLALGINYMKIRKFKEAEKYVVECIRLNKRNILAYLNLGAIYSAQKRYNESMEIFNRVIHLSSKETRAYLGLARIYVQLNDSETANSYFKKVIELEPASALAELAKKSIVETIQINKSISDDNRIENLSKGMSCYLSNNYIKASEQYKEYLRNQPSDDYVWYLMGETQIRLANLDEAVDCFRKAIRINSKRGLYYKSLGISLFYQNKFDEALNAIKKTIDLDKKDSLTLTLYGVILNRNQKYLDAIQQFKAVLRKNPNNPLAMYQSAYALIQLKDTKKASELLDKVNAFEYFAPIKEQSKNLLKTI